MHTETTREKTLLDLFFTTNPTLLRSSVSAPGIADHDIVVTDIDTKPVLLKQQKRKCFVFAKANWQGLNESISSDLANIVQSMISQGKPIDDVWTCFKTTLLLKVENFVPSKMKGGRSKIPWLTKDIKRVLRKKQRLYKQAKNTNSWSNYRHFQRECKRSIRKAEWTFINDIILEGFKKNNTKPFWQYVMNRKQDNIGVSPLMDKSTLFSDSKSKLEYYSNSSSQYLPRKMDPHFRKWTHHHANKLKTLL